MVAKLNHQEGKCPSGRRWGSVLQVKETEPSEKPSTPITLAHSNPPCFEQVLLLRKQDLKGGTEKSVLLCNIKGYQKKHSCLLSLQDSSHDNYAWC